MLNISLNDFLKLKDIRFVNITESAFRIRRIKGISIDSRSIEPDQIFWAIKGERFDGHAFVREAHAKSALCSVISESKFAEFSYDNLPLVIVPDTLNALQELSHIQRLKYEIPVIALTGSNGKTTTKEMIAQIMQSKINIHKTKGNQNNQIGCPLTMLHLTEHNEAAVLELGTNQFGEIDILTKMVQPTHALITLIADTHLEFLESREGVAREKFSLFNNLKNGSTIYLNLDDPLISKYKRKALRYVTYSFEKTADVQGKIGEMDENGCGILRVNDQFDIKLQVPGLHNLHNALAAVTVALDFGFSNDEITKALSEYKGFEKRMQIVKWNDVTIVNDAYNANPGSMYLAIETSLNIKHKGKVILALGDMNELGVESNKMHADLLQFIVRNKVDKTYLVGNKMAAALTKVKKSDQKKFVLCSSLSELAGKLTKTVKSGDLLLLKGSRSMQMEKIMGLLP